MFLEIDKEMNQSSKERTDGGALTNSGAGLAEVVGPPPGADLDLDAVPGPGLQVTENHPVLQDVAHVLGL